MNDVTVSKTNADDNEIADHLHETQRVAENITRDVRDHAEFFRQYKRCRVWTALMNTDADLQVWRRLKLQLRLNPTLTS